MSYMNVHFLHILCAQFVKFRFKLNINDLNIFLTVLEAFRSLCLLSQNQIKVQVKAILMCYEKFCNKSEM